MANEADLKLIQIPEFPKTDTLVGSGPEYVVLTKADGVTYGMLTEDFKDFLGTVQVQVPKALAPTDPAPTLDGVYEPAVNGVYSNAGGLERLSTDGYVRFIKNGATWVKVNTPMPAPDLTPLATKTAVQSLQDTLLSGNLKLTNGAFWDTSGSRQVGQAGYWYTPKMPVTEGMEFVNPFQGAGIAAQAVLFNADGTFNSSINGQAKITIPAGIGEIAFSTNSGSTKITSPSSLVAIQVRKETEAVSDNLTTNYQIDYFSSGQNVAEFAQTDTQFSPNSTTGGYLNTSGVFVPSAGIFVTDYIPIDKTKAVINLRTVMTGSAAICTFRKDLSLVEGKTAAGLGGVQGENTFNLKEGFNLSEVEYVRASCFIPATVRLYYTEKTKVSLLFDRDYRTQSVQQIQSVAQVSQVKSAVNEAVILQGDDLASLFKFKNKGDANTVYGWQNSTGGISNSPVNEYFTSGFVPLKELTNYEWRGQILGGLSLLLFAENKVSITKVMNLSTEGATGSITTLNFATPEGTAFGRFTSALPMSLISGATYQRAIAPASPTVLKIDKPLNPFKYSLGDKARLTVKFQLKKDFNASKEITLLSDNLSNGLNVKLVGGNTVECFHNYLNQSDPAAVVNCQRPNPTIKLEVKIAGLAAVQTVNVNSSMTDVFLGQKFFSIRYKGTPNAGSANMNMFVRSGSLSIANGATVLKSYLLSSYAKVSDLCNAITADLSGVLSDFELLYHDITDKSPLNIANFEPVKFVAHFPTYSEATRYKSFPIAVRKFDEKIHTFEVMKNGSQYALALDGVLYGTQPGTLILRTDAIATPYVGDEATILSIEVSDSDKRSFPQIRNYYMHRIVGNFNETVPDGTNLGKLADFADEMEKRGVVSISKNQLAAYLYRGEPLPEKCYTLNFDDSVNEMFEIKSVRNLFQSRGIKPHTSSIMNWEGDAQFIVSVEGVISGTVPVGQRLVYNTNYLAIYLGASKFHPNRIMLKLSGDHNYATIFNNNVSMVIAGEISNNIIVNANTMSLSNKEECFWSEHTYKRNDAEKVFGEYGFNFHLHDFDHGDALTTYDYPQFVDHVQNGIAKFRHRFGKDPGHYVYPYGYITPMHAEVLKDEGIMLGYTSLSLNTGLAVKAYNLMMIPRVSIDGNTNMKLIGQQWD